MGKVVPVCGLSTITGLPVDCWIRIGLEAAPADPTTCPKLLMRSGAAVGLGIDVNTPVWLRISEGRELTEAPLAEEVMATVVALPWICNAWLVENVGLGKSCGCLDMDTAGLMVAPDCRVSPCWPNTAVVGAAKRTPPIGACSAVAAPVVGWSWIWTIWGEPVEVASVCPDITVG